MLFILHTKKSQALTHCTMTQKTLMYFFSHIGSDLKMLLYVEAQFSPTISRS